MGVNLVIFGIDAEQREQLIVSTEEDFDEFVEEAVQELIPAVDAAGRVWHAPRTEKSWDVMHFLLTDTQSDTGQLSGRLFEITGTHPEIALNFGHWAGIADEAQTRAVARRLLEVDEDAMRERLRRVPAQVYGADSVGIDARWDDEIIADATDLAAFVGRCADASLGMVLVIG